MTRVSNKASRPARGVGALNGPFLPISRLCMGEISRLKMGNRDGRARSIECACFGDGWSRGCCGEASGIRGPFGHVVDSEIRGFAP